MSTAAKGIASCLCILYDIHTLSLGYLTGYRMESSSTPPPGPHPTAQAFFDALDSRRPSSQRQSPALQRHSRSLGWRNRYSQQDQYPISMRAAGGREIQFSVQQLQRGEVEGTYGTGATVWPAAMVLLKYLERHPHLVSGRRVVDLGSGTGVTSLAAGLLGAVHVLCTDGEESVVRLAQDNCRRAMIQTQMEPGSSHHDKDTVRIGACPIRVEKYWWGTQPLPDDQCEVILVADCVLPKLYPIAPLVAAIDDLLRAGARERKPIAILSYEHRYYPDYDPRIKFQELVHARGLRLEIVPQERQDPIYNVDDIEIWQVTLQ
jgi:SAM-dependent methyltransferase